MKSGIASVHLRVAIVSGAFIALVSAPAFADAMAASVSASASSATSVALTNFRGAWSSTSLYASGAVVTYNGASYVCLNKCSGTLPTSKALDWAILDAPGATGQVGATGATGAQGPAGPAGAAGQMGAPGPIGAAGAKGATGSTGPAGPSGPTGSPGTMGATGSVGPQGPAGSTGAQGPAGPQGPAGQAGSAGVAGTLTVYDSANTLVGTLIGQNVAVVNANGQSVLASLSASGFSASNTQQVTFYHVTADCSGTRYVNAASVPVSSFIVGTLLYFGRNPVLQMTTTSIESFDSGADVSQPGACTSFNPFSVLLSALGVFDLQTLALVPPFSIH